MLAVLRSGLLLPLFLHLPHKIHAMDGCQGDYGHLYWRCGDICTYADGSPKQECFCGNSSFGPNDGQWCCGHNCTGGGCLKLKEGVGVGWGRHKEDPDGYFWNHPAGCADWSPAKCTTGIALNLNESCKGECNFYGEDRHRNYLTIRSHPSACLKTNTCVKEGEGNTWTRDDIAFKPTICTGDSSCEGELDWCREEERKKEECPNGGVSNHVWNNYFTRCLRISRNKEERNETKSIPGQCIEKAKWRDGKENNCLDRSDEDPFQEAVNNTSEETVIPFARLTNCTSKFGNGSRGNVHGLECGGQESSGCRLMNSWCITKVGHKCPVLGGGIQTNNPILCANNNFWRQQNTGGVYGWIYIYIRCQAGNSGQIVNRVFWGVDGLNNNGGVDLTCTDGSDKYRPLKQRRDAEGPGHQPSQTDHNNHGHDEVEVNDDQPPQSQVWKTQPRPQLYAERDKEKYREDPESGLWIIEESDPFKVPPISVGDFEKGPQKYSSQSMPLSTYLFVLVMAGNGIDFPIPRKKEWFNFYRNQDYAKDERTNFMVAAPTEKTCKAYDGFVCKVRFVILITVIDWDFVC